MLDYTEYNKETNEEYISFFEDMLMRSFASLAEPSDNREVDVAYYHITATINTKGMPWRESAYFTFNRFDILYNQLCEGVLGRNNYRKIKAAYRPVAVAFLDVEGSKYANRQVPLINPHIHSVWAVHPFQVEKMDSAIRKISNTSFTNRYQIDEVDCGRLASKDDLRRVLSYDSKYAKYHFDNSELERSYEVYPKVLKSASRSLTLPRGGEGAAQA